MVIIIVPVLASSNTFIPFRVEADSLDFITKVVLSQLSKEDNKWHSVTFFSKSLFMIECNYEIHNKEMLVVIWALEE